MALTKAGLARQARFNELREDIRKQTADIKVSEVLPIPILHNEEVIYLQYWGWSINLYPDGTYFVEVTEGG